MMPKIRILLDTPSLPVVEIREFQQIPNIGELVEIKAHLQEKATYKVGEILHQIDVTDYCASIVLQADTGKQNSDANATLSNNISDEHKKVYEQAKNYNNVIQLAGYAGFFAMWKMFETKIDAHSSARAALWMGASLFIFVLFEIIGMIGRAFGSSGYGNSNSILLKIGISIENIHRKIWGPFLVLTIALAVYSISILSYRIYGLISND